MNRVRILVAKIPLPYVWALVISASFFAAMSLLEAIMFRRSFYWVTHPVIIPFYQRFLFVLAVFWWRLEALGPIFFICMSLSMASLIVAIRRKIWIPPPRGN